MSRDFLLPGFFHESVSPQPHSIPLGPFQIQKFFEILASQGAPAAMTSAANFATSLASVVDTGGKFVTGVNKTANDTGGNLPPVSTKPVENLPPVSMAQVANNGNNIRLLRP